MKKIDQETKEIFVITAFVILGLIYLIECAPTPIAMGWDFVKQQIAHLIVEGIQTVAAPI